MLFYFVFTFVTLTISFLIFAWLHWPIALKPPQSCYGVYTLGHTQSCGDLSLMFPCHSIGLRHFFKSLSHQYFEIHIERGWSLKRQSVGLPSFRTQVAPKLTHVYSIIEKSDVGLTKCLFSYAMMRRGGQPQSRGTMAHVIMRFEKGYFKAIPKRHYECNLWQPWFHFIVKWTIVVLIKPIEGDFECFSFIGLLIICLSIIILY